MNTEEQVRSDYHVLIRLLLLILEIQSAGFRQLSHKSLNIIIRESPVPKQPEGRSTQSLRLSQGKYILSLFLGHSRSSSLANPRAFTPIGNTWTNEPALHDLSDNHSRNNEASMHNHPN
jgi:hypothetical protein